MKNSLQSLCMRCVILPGATAALGDHASSCLWKLWKSRSDIFRLNGVISLYSTKYEMLIVKFCFSVLESVGIVEVLLR